VNVYTMDCGHEFSCVHLHPLYRPAFCDSCQHTAKLMRMTSDPASDGSGADDLATQYEDIDWQPLSPRGADVVTGAEAYLRAWLQIDVSN
jgi:hypothetical protein